MANLTQKQESFCQLYLELGNASEAYRQSYSCKNMKMESINNKAYELLHKVDITARIKELQEATAQKSEITKERILEELSAILESKITDYVEFDGNNIKFKAFSKLTEQQVKAIESIKEGRNGIELKLHGKSWTIERICKMLGFDAPTKQAFTDKDGESLFNPIEVRIVRNKKDIDDATADNSTR